MIKIVSHLHNFFIPHEGNNHLPHSVHHKNLLRYSAMLIVSKALIVALLFVSFPSIAEFSTITQKRITELTNQSRTEAGLQKLTINTTLQRAAELKLQDMISNGYFAHTSPAGIVPWHWFKEAGYLYTYAGENLAMNFSEAEDAHDAWMNSPTHRANILNGNYREIGVAVGIGEIDGDQATLVVQLFGTSFVPPVVTPEPEPEVVAVPSVQGETVEPVQVRETPEPQTKPVEPTQPVEPVATEPEPVTIVQTTPEPIVEQPEAPVEIQQDIVEPIRTPVTSQPVVDKPVVTPSQDIAPFEAPLPTEPQAVTGEITGGSQEVTFGQEKDSQVVGYILRFIESFYWVILGFIAFALLLKIFIRVRVQHKSVIAHGMFVIALGILLIALHLHFLDAVSGPVIVF